MSEENKQLILRQIEALNEGDLETAAGLVGSDFLDHDAAPSRANGPVGLLATLEHLHEAFAGFRFEPLDLIAEADRVVVRARVSGRHVGPFAGRPATDREFSVQQIHIWRLAGGLVVEHWACGDHLRALRQLGVLP